MSPQRRAMVWMSLFALLWVLVEAMAARLGRPYSAYQVVWSRYAAHLGFMVVVWGWRDWSSLWHTNRPGFQIARSMLMLSMPTAVIMAISQGAGSDSVLAVFWVAPLLLLTLARVLLGERVIPAMWFVCTLATIGAALSLWRGWPQSSWLIALPLVSAASFSIYVVMTRVLRHENVRANLFYTALGVCIALTPVIPSVWVTPTVRDAVLLCGVGVFGFVALYALDRMAAVAPVSAAAPLGLLQVAFTLGGRTASTGQLGVRALIGLLCIGAAVSWTWARQSPIREAPAV